MMIQYRLSLELLITLNHEMMARYDSMANAGVHDYADLQNVPSFAVIAVDNLPELAGDDSNGCIGGIIRSVAPLVSR